MLINFSVLEKMGFEIHQVDDGLIIQPIQENDVLSRAISKQMQSPDFTDRDRDNVISASINEYNKVLLNKAVQS